MMVDLKKIMLGMLGIVLLMVFSYFIIRLALQTSYGIKNLNIEDSDVAKVTATLHSTSRNGYFEGTVTNVTDGPINKYLQADLYSKNGNWLAREYLNLGTINSGDKKDFKLEYDHVNAESAILKIIDPHDVSDTVQPGKWYFDITDHYPNKKVFNEVDNSADRTRQGMMGNYYTEAN